MAAVVARTPHEPRVPVLDHDRAVVEDRDRRVAARERGPVDEGLERRSGLAQRLGGPVELARPVVASAHHGEHVARRGLEREQRALDLGLLVEGDPRRGGDDLFLAFLVGDRLGLLGIRGLGLAFGEQREPADVAHREDPADLRHRARAPLDGGLARPVDVREVHLGRELGSERDDRHVGLRVHPGHDAQDRLVLRELRREILLFDLLPFLEGALGLRCGQLVRVGLLVRRLLGARGDVRQERLLLVSRGLLFVGLLGQEVVLLGELQDLVLDLALRHPAHVAAVAVAMVVGDEALLDGPVRRALQAEVDGGLDPQPAFEHRVSAEPLVEVAAHLFGEVHRGHVVGVRLVGREHRYVGHRVFGALLVDRPHREHAADHRLSPALGGVPVAVGRVLRRALGQAREHRRLGHRQLAHVLVEVRLRRRPDPVGAVSEVDLVQIEVEDFVLAEARLDLARQDHLSDLAAEAALGAEQHLLHELHRDRARAFLDLAGAQVDPGGPDDGPVVDPRVLEEVLVLGGHEGEAGVLGDLGEGRDVAPLVVVLADREAVAVDDHAREGRSEVLDALEVRQIAEEARVEPIAARTPDEDQQQKPQQCDPEPPGPDESHANSSTYRTLARSITRG